MSWRDFAGECDSREEAEVNDNLQQQAVTIFRSWFVNCVPFGGIAPDEWKNVTLEDITAMVSRGITPKYADDTDQIVINQKCIRNHMIDLSLHEIIGRKLSMISGFALVTC